MRRPTLNSPRNNRTAHGSDPSTATCLLFSRLLSSTPKSKLSKQQQQQWRTTRRPKNHRRRRRRRWGASRTTPSAPSRPSSTSPASSPTPSSPSFSTMFSSPDCLLFFFFVCVSVILWFWCVWCSRGDADLPGASAQVEVAQEPEAAELGCVLLSSLKSDPSLGRAPFFPLSFCFAMGKVLSFWLNSICWFLQEEWCMRRGSCRRHVSI